jgi:RimJ/RimL family protein N-acetyltransferase
MTLRPATSDDLTSLAQWRELDRIDLLTCRPIKDGKRISTQPEPITYAFFLPEPEYPIAKVSCFDFNPRNRSAEFGYRVHPDFRRKGVGTQMLSSFFDQMFSAAELNKLYCQTGAFNQPSIRLLEKLGLHRDAVLREHHELDGKLWDDYVYSILGREWSDSRSDQAQPQGILNP